MSTDNPAVEPRLDLDETVPGVGKALAHLDHAVTRELDRVGVPAGLRDLLRVRASQVNGCAYCVDMHTKDARAGGESEQRLIGLPVWRETPFYTAAERAALALTEAIVTMSVDHVPSAVVDEAKAHYDLEQVGALIGLVVAINAWNAVGVTTRAWEPGSYEPGS